MLESFIGQRFGRLVLLDIDKSCNYKTTCQCDCGKITHPSFFSLRDGTTKSCGCLKNEKTVERSTKHGFAKRFKKDRIYNIWLNMKQRCLNPNHPRYKDYGGKGVMIFSDWRDNFLSFYNWSMEHNYKTGLTIDRIDVDGNYEPCNCRWISLSENSGLAHRQYKNGIHEMLKNGVSHREIANSMGVHISTVIRWAHKLGFMS